MCRPWLTGCECEASPMAGPSQKGRASLSKRRRTCWIRQNRRRLKQATLYGVTWLTGAILLRPVWRPQNRHYCAATNTGNFSLKRTPRQYIGRVFIKDELRLPVLAVHFFPKSCTLTLSCGFTSAHRDSKSHTRLLYSSVLPKLNSCWWSVPVNLRTIHPSTSIRKYPVHWH